MNSSKVSLIRIFELQNQVIQKHIQDYTDLYKFISNCFDFLAIEISSIEWQVIPENRRKLFNFYHADVVSTLINAVRLSFQGCETDAYALLRVVNQELGEFNSIIELSLYEQAYVELRDKSMKGKDFSDGFQKEIGKFKDKKRETVYGKLSNIGSHPSPARVALSIQKDASRQKTKVGMMINNPNIETSLLLISEHFLYAIRVFDEYFIRNLMPSIQSPVSANREIAEIEYQKIMDAHTARVRDGKARNRSDG